MTNYLPNGFAVFDTEKRCVAIVHSVAAAKRLRDLAYFRKPRARIGLKWVPVIRSLPQVMPGVYRFPSAPHTGGR